MHDSLAGDPQLFGTILKKTKFFGTNFKGPPAWPWPLYTHIIINSHCSPPRPRAAAGHFVSFGCTEEKLIVENVGCRAHGIASEAPFSHARRHRRWAAGWVGAPLPGVAGCYLPRCDRRQHVKRHKLRLLIADPNGGVMRSSHMWLRSLGKRARVGRDATVYGAHSPRAFATQSVSTQPRMTDHGACMSYACVRGEADAFQKGLSQRPRARSLTPGRCLPPKRARPRDSVARRLARRPSLASSGPRVLHGLSPSYCLI